MNNQDTDYTRHYLKWHSDKNEHIESMISFYQRMLLPYLPANRDSNILDVGCGMGFALLSLQKIGYTHIQGIELDSGQVNSCLKKNLPVELVTDTIHYLNNQPDKYDVIICLDVIEHIPHQEQLYFVKAINIALKKAGKLICTVPNANSTLASRWRYIDWTHHISFTEDSLDFLLFNAGFDNINVFETEFFNRPQISLLSAIVKKSMWKVYLHWWLFRAVRSLRRLEMIAELGWEQGYKIPLSLNILATANKSS